MNDTTFESAPQSTLAEDDAASLIGRRVARPGALRLLAGRGVYLDDLELPRMAHVVYLRSPHAHARIVSIDTDAARAMSGVIALVDGNEIAQVCTPWVATLSHMVGMQSAPQFPLATERVCWQGEAVLAVVAETRAQAEDALQHVVVEWEPLPAAVHMETALSPDSRCGTRLPARSDPARLAASAREVAAKRRAPGK